jgi:cell division protein FtsQ
MSGLRRSAQTIGPRGVVRRPPAKARRRPGLRRLTARRRIGPRVLATVIALLVIAGGVFLWLRDSSLVAVQKVRITGVSGPDAHQIRRALLQAARNMTTLDVKTAALQTAVAPFPVVKHLVVSTDFPHGMTIHVVEQVPVAVVVAPGRRILVSGDGTLLHEVGDGVSLPTLSLGVMPGGSRLKGYALSEIRLLAAAPYQLLARLSAVQDGSAHGLVAQFRNGPSVYFGGSTQLGAKWAAATEVLANPGSAGAVYIDVTDPSRPAAGAGSDTNTTAGSSTTTASATG